MPEQINVAVGVLVERSGDQPLVLIARRPGDAVLAGFWELPGGKIEPGESPRHCLVREFREELGLDVAVGDELPGVEHVYDHGHVRLRVFLCTWLSGEPRNLQVDEHRWVPAADLTRYRFPPANEGLMDQIVQVLDPPQ